MLCISSPEFIRVIIESLYPWTDISMGQRLKNCICKGSILRTWILPNTVFQYAVHVMGWVILLVNLKRSFLEVRQHTSIARCSLMSKVCLWIVFREKNLMFTTHFINFVKTYFGVYHLGVDKSKDSRRNSQKSGIQVQAMKRFFRFLFFIL